MEIEMVMLNGKFSLKWIWNSLYEFEMNELKAKINEEIKISKKKENWARKNINNLEKIDSELKSTLRDIQAIKTIKFLLAHGIKDIFIR